MFLIGDKVVYPLHGAGVIQDIEEKEILGKKQYYYILKMATEPMGKLQIMIPIEKSEEVGIRQVVDLETMEDVLYTLHDDETDSSTTWNQRYRINADKMKSGDIYKGTEVIRDLARLNKVKPLGTGEKKMLDNALQILISELVLVKGIGEEQATAFLDKIIYN
ncbi:CarD family transcriptional regulator [Hazenella coriacea]|uniref:CarD family transcriptional regulator n=1 Tax=Hazenella coriacea TaxID=1179467 RepID=A0A4R3L3U1_9BACL|nr:CarD family transcriptional regulator [Hazenella coriacea]TCS93585.1 CarD family transcriptional regulator [Hazenella coriacea]